MNQQQQGTEAAPFYIAIRAEGHLVNAWLMPSRQVIEGAGQMGEHKLKEPVLIGSVSRAACDSTGGQEGAVFQLWERLMELVVTVSCQEALGFTPTSFTSSTPPDSERSGNA